MNKKTFYDWCIDNNKKIYLQNWNYEKNNFSPKECTYGSAKKIFFKCPRGLHEDTYKPINNITGATRHNKNNYCLYCNSFKQWCLDNNHNDLINLWDYKLNKISPDKVGYSSNNAYYFKCKRGLHESHKHVIQAITGNNHNLVKCKKCNSIAQYGIDNIDEDFIDKYWSDKNETNPFEIQLNSRNKIWIKCQYCEEDYLIKSYHFTSGVRHKGCSLLSGKSNLQRKVENYIKEKYGQYTLLHENNCSIIPKSPITDYNMYFDNEIKELKLLIEVHGQQHYKSCTWDKHIAKRDNTTREKVFKKRQLYDQYKKSYALELGYSYLEIPYWTETNESYKELIDNKINNIMKEIA